MKDVDLTLSRKGKIRKNNFHWIRDDLGLQGSMDRSREEGGSRETHRGLSGLHASTGRLLPIRRMLMNLSDPRTTSARIDREISPICMHDAFGFLCLWKPVVSGDRLLGHSFYGFCLGQQNQDRRRIIR